MRKSLGILGKASNFDTAGSGFESQLNQYHFAIFCSLLSFEMAVTFFIEFTLERVSVTVQRAQKGQRILLNF